MGHMGMGGLRSSAQDRCRAQGSLGQRQGTEAQGRGEVWVPKTD